MLISNLVLAEYYDYLVERFKIGYASLRRPDPTDLPVEKIELGQGATTSVQEYTTTLADKGKYETHDHYFDTHYIVAGCEGSHLALRDTLEEKIPYDAERDITTYHNPETVSQVILSQGELIIAALEEAHVPRMIAGESCMVKKVVPKVPVS